MNRITRTTGIAAAALALWGTPALAASPSEEAEATAAVYNQVAAEARDKLDVVRSALRLEPASAGNGPVLVSAEDGVEARVINTASPNATQLAGHVFMDRFAQVGRLEAKFSVAFSALPLNSSTPLSTTQAVRSPVANPAGGVFTDRTLWTLRPPLYPDGTAPPADVARRLKADVNITVDPPKLGELLSLMGVPDPQNMAQLARLIDDRLTPADYSGPAVLCKYYAPTDPEFCGRLTPSEGDDDPTHARLLAKAKDVDVVPAHTLVGGPLFSLVNVEPLAIPAVSAWFRLPSFDDPEPSNLWCETRNFALLLVPDITPGIGSDPVSAAENLRERLEGVGTALNKLDRLAGLGSVDSGINSLLGKLALVNPLETRAWKGNANDLNQDPEFQMVGNGRCSSVNDIEANDEISSMALFGLPGASVRAFTGKSGNGSVLTTSLPSSSTTWLTTRSNLYDFNNAISSISPGGAGTTQ